MPQREPSEYRWVVTYFEYRDPDDIKVEVLATFKSEEGKDKFLLRLMRVGSYSGRTLNLNHVKATLVQTME